MSIFNPFSRNSSARKALKDFEQILDSGLLALATQPRDNKVDFSDQRLRRLYVFLIDHDYPGGSAAMHNAAFRRYRLPYRSCFLIGDPSSATEIFAALRSCPLYFGGGAGSGFKDKIAGELDQLAQSAQVIGSVNVIARSRGRFEGHNTDGSGFVAGLLSEYPKAVTGKRIVILGAGGTALPISYELALKKPRDITIINRTVDKARNIVALVDGLCPAYAAGEDAIGAALENADLVVNTSNKGAQPNEQFSAFAAMTGDVAGDLEASKRNIARLPKNAIVADILLEPMTRTLQLAQEAGHRTHSGRNMNLYQAAPAFNILTGLNKSEKTLRNVMASALK
jgi:shikimate dehydrogenase